MEDVLTQLSTDELLRMLELLDMLESKAPIQASDRVRTYLGQSNFYFV